MAVEAENGIHSFVCRSAATLHRPPSVCSKQCYVWCCKSVCQMTWNFIALCAFGWLTRATIDSNIYRMTRRENKQQHQNDRNHEWCEVAAAASSFASVCRISHICSIEWHPMQNRLKSVTAVHLHRNKYKFVRLRTFDIIPAHNEWHFTFNIVCKCMKSMTLLCYFK